MIARFVIALMFLNAATPIAGYAQRRLPSLSRRSAVTAPGTLAAVDYPLTTVLTRDSQSDTVDQRVELTAPWILGVEASIVVVSAAGYFARAAGFEPGRGAKEVGKGLGYTGLGGAILLLPLGFMYYPDDLSVRILAIVCGAAMLTGGYNLYLAKQDPTAAEVFRANLIALNAAALASWLVARRLHLLR